MNAQELLEELTEKRAMGNTSLIGGKVAIIDHAITSIGHGLSEPSVCQRQVIIEGKKFLIQVVSL